MTQFIRGSAITFRATCLDDAKQPFTPTKAMLTLSFVSTVGERRRVDIPLSVVGPQVAANWDSSVASDAMPVAWHIRASGPGGKVASDGTFVLTAAQANPTFP